MALVTLDGRTKSQPVLPGPTVNSYVEVKVPVKPSIDKAKVDTGPVISAAMMSSVLDINRFSNIVGQMRRYVQGRAATVTYYHRVSDSVTTSVDTDTDLGSLNNSYFRINNFEIRLEAEFSYTFTEQDNISGYQAGVIFYPGFIPKGGDFFLLRIDPQGSVGEFMITSVTRLSIMAHTCHRAVVELVDFATQEKIDAYERQVAKVFHFHVQSSMGGKVAMLETSDKAMLQDISQSIRLMKSMYVEQFYSRTHNAFIHPDNFYDAYLAEFLRNIFDMDDIRSYPQAVHAGDYNFSYWGKLGDPEMVLPGEIKRFHSIRVIKQFAAFDTRINSLIGVPSVILTYDDEDSLPYITDGLASIDPEEQTDFDRLVRLFLEQNKIDPLLLLELSKSYRTMSPDEQFYKVPILLYFLLLLTNTIMEGRGPEMYANAIDYLPTELSFTAENLQDQFLIIRTNNKAIGVIDDQGKQRLFMSGDVEYIDDLIKINLTTMFLNYTGDLYFADNALVHVGTLVEGGETIEVENGVNVEVGMAVLGVGIPSKTYVKAVHEQTIMLSNEATVSIENTELIIDYPKFEGTWKLVLTGNVVAGGEGTMAMVNSVEIELGEVW